ncbi:MAG: 50S ribosomal protein L18 [Planctomycetales bacterium]|nr:50S ribosomal protein L18 [Planctomycetales bacterium]
MEHNRSKLRLRQRRKFRVRKRLKGTSERPRMSVFRSHKHMYVQLIDDDAGKTLVSASSMDGELKGGINYGGNKDAAQAIGKVVAERALAQGIKQVCFDRGSCKYHGRLAALADAAREAGLAF